MALTADASGRITTQPNVPSGSSMPPELAAIIASSMAGTSSGGGASNSIPPLMIPIRKGATTREVRLEGKGWRTVDTGNAITATTIDEAINAFFAMDDDYRESVMERMYYYGLIDGPNNLKQAVGAWEDAVTLAANFKAAGKDADPMSMFQRMTNLKAGQLGNQPRTVTSRQFGALDPEQAKVWIRQAFQASVGRDPHDAEIRQLIGSLQQGFKSNPAVTQQTVDADGNSTTRQIDPGFDPQAYIANEMNNDPEASAHQAAGTLYPALIEALRSPV